MSIRNAFLSLSVFCTAICTSPALAKEKWPREIKLKENGVVTIYQPQPEQYVGNSIDGRSVVSVKKTKGAEPIFGVVWFKAITQTDRDKRTVVLEDVVITRAKFPDVADTNQVRKLTNLLEEEIPKWDLEVSMEDLLSAIKIEQGSQSTDLNTDPPEIIYQKVTSLLVFIDGEPIVKEDEKMKMERVLNTPFLILKSPEDKKFYLYSGEYWYRSASVTSGWDHTTKLPKSIASFDEQIKKQDKEKKQADQQTADKNKSKKPPVIVVRTKPAELIQTDGEPDYKSVPSTTLLYVANTPNNIVKDINTQKVFLLLSGRWYTAATLDGPWAYVASDKLPADFAKIPEGSAVDGVLSSVAGTDAANEAAMDAQIPQTAKVDKKNATTKISYDGEPKFTPIKGTSLSVAENASGTVLRSGGKYYAVDNGVWFESNNPTGPWAVATERPEDVDKIPADNSAYNTKYVYIYDNTPDYVYMGYTPGYTGCYLYGPTVVYGTGYHYAPWYGAVYYPRPVTWGFSMHYNPWTGWSFGIGFSTGAFSMTFGFGGGWYGPPMYRPPYVNPYYRGGYYGGGYGNRYNNININNDINIDRGDRNNIYNNRDHVSTRPTNPNRGDGQIGGNRPGGGGSGTANRPSQLPAGGNRPGSGGSGTASQLPAGGNRPGSGGSGTASQLPAGGNRPGGGGSGTASQLPAGGNRPGGGGSGTASQLPAGGNRPGGGGSGTASQLPAGGNRPGGGGSGTASQLPAGGNRAAHPSQQPNNMISDRSGNVYRQENGGNYSQRQNNSWQNADRQQIQNSQMQRDRANQRTNNFQNHGGGGGYRGGGGGGGFRGGGGRGGGRR